MKKSFFFLTIIGTLIFMGCSDNTFTVSSDISDPNIREIVLTNVIDNIYDTISVPQSEPLELAGNKNPGIIKVTSNRLSTYVFSEPGVEIKIQKSPQDDSFIIESTSQENQDLLAEYEEFKTQIDAKTNVSKLGKMDYDELQSVLTEKYEELAGFLEEKKEGNYDKKLLEWLSFRNKAGEANDLLFYPSYYEYFMKEEADLPEDYYAFKEAFNFENEQYFYFDDVKSVAENIMSSDIEYEDAESVADYYSSIYHNVGKFTNNPVLKEMFQFKIINNKLNYGGGIDGMKEEINNFIASSDNSHRVNKLKYLAAQWEHLEKGLEAPDFTAFARDGQEVRLSDLKGKNVYIDVWATWCGPCIREIPSLKAMEEKYHEDNLEFVSVSIDKASDKEKWMNFIVERELGGTQLMSEGDWNSEVTNNYNIKGIPRFIMIDKEGKIVSADAPRPSNTDQFENMVSEVLD